MFFLDYDDAPSAEENNELWEKYLHFKEGAVAYIDEEEAVTIIEELDDKDLWDEAFSFIQKIECFYPNSSALAIKKADILISLEKTEEAKEVLDSLMNYDRNDVEYFLLRTEIDIILDGDMDKVRAWMNRAVQVLSVEDYSDYIHDLIEMLETYELSDLLFDCVLSLLELYEDWENSHVAELLLLLPLFTEKAENLDGAVRLAHRVTQKMPYAASAWMALGIAYGGQKKYAEAIDAFMFVRAIDESLIEVLPKIVYAYIRLKKTDPAISVLLDYLEYKPDDVQSLRQLGACYAKKKQYSLAVYYLRMAQQNEPQNHAILADIAQIYIDTKDYASAVRELEKALVLIKEPSSYFGLVAHCYYELGNYSEAAKYFSLALTGNLKCKDYWEGLLRVFVRTKDFDQLYTMSVEALRHTKQHYFLYYLAYAEFKQGKQAPAFYTLQNAIAMAPRKYSKLSLFIPISQIPKPVGDRP